MVLRNLTLLNVFILPEIDGFGQKLDFVQSDIVRAGPRELLLSQLELSGLVELEAL